MKPRILNFGVEATHPTISALNSFLDPTSISDFDAFVLDPQVLGAQVERLSVRGGPATFRARLEEHGHPIRETLLRQRSEVRALLEAKGGLVLSLLRPNDVMFHATGEGGAVLSFDKYCMLSGLIMNSGNRLPLTPIPGGQSSTITMAQGVKAVGLEFLRILRGQLVVHAHFPILATEFDQIGTALAIDSVGYPVAAEFAVGTGKVVFVPVPTAASAERVGAAIAQTVRTFFAGTAEIEEPDWAAWVSVPGADLHDNEISELRQQAEAVTSRIEALVEQRQQVLNHKRLLFAYGKAVLEPAVRSAFRILGFAVSEPDEYPGEWDVMLVDPTSRSTAICEVEGSENAIDSDKYRQLLDYIDAEAQQGRIHKGLLVGNGFRLTSLDSAERAAQFTENVVRGAIRIQFCLIPTTELFKAVCSVLEHPADEELKNRTRQALLACIGEWRFATLAEPGKPAPAQSGK